MNTSIVQRLITYPLLTEQERLIRLDRNDSRSLFSRVIGQDGALQMIFDALDSAYQNQYRLTEIPAILLHGGRSNGKTMLAKTIGDALERYVLRCDATSTGPDELFQMIAEASQEVRCPMVELGRKNGKPQFKAPNIIVFIDEIHALRNKTVMNLLTALESSDKIMMVRDAYLDVSNILWIGATTELGDLFAPFESRFFKIPMLDISKKELTTIIHTNFSEFSNDECTEIANKSGVIAREAIGLAKAIQLNVKRLHCSVMEGIKNVCLAKGIDEHGTTKQQVWVLRALSERPQGLNYEQLCRIAQCNIEELKRYVLPPLLADLPAKVVWTGQRSCLTTAGAMFLQSCG